MLTVIAIIGPTASGKSGLAIDMAKHLTACGKKHGIRGAEVISADSRQVYRGLDIGSGKITAREAKGVPHHMLDVASPLRTYTVAQYQKQGRKILNALLKKNIIPIVCGGTGQYLDALLRDMRLPEVKPDPLLRRKLEKLGTEELFALLKKKDPIRAKSIDRFNRRRLVRAIEIAEHMGVSPAGIGSKLLYPTLFIGITPPQNELHEKIRARLRSRLQAGMITEVARLHKEGVSWDRLDKFGLEYRYVSRYVRGLISKKEMTDQLFAEIKKYAKRQMTWFKRNKDTLWIPRPDLHLIKTAVEDLFLR